MKKLKVKVFSIIFGLLTLFTIILFTISLTRTYIEKKNSVSNILTRIPKTFETLYQKYRPEFTQNRKYLDDERRVYLDFTVYTIILDDNGYYQEVINNTNNDELDEESIKSIANLIIDNHKDNYYIGNLFVSKYSYVFMSNNTLVIMDNSYINSQLINQLVTYICMFILCEALIFVITYLITKWITKPVKISFERQKAFVADASHELKTPLSVMIASADAYFNDKDDKWVINMKNESERMIKLVTELLDLAKTEQEQDINMTQNNLSNIVESSILTFESLFFENKINFKYDIRPDINMVCNENLIVELISILIDNAIKYCSDKGKVNVKLYKDNKQIILEVKNTGASIKKEDEEKIFERFYKVDSSRNRNTNNYGLGLAIAKNIVSIHNGEIKAHSSNGYTTFKVIWNQK